MATGIENFLSMVDAMTLAHCQAFSAHSFTSPELSEADFRGMAEVLRKRAGRVAYLARGIPVTRIPSRPEKQLDLISKLIGWVFHEHEGAPDYLPPDCRRH
jgi:hypothetical protein